MTLFRTLRLLVVAVLLAVGLAACSTSGGDKKADSTTTSAADDPGETTTTEGDEPDTTTTEPDEPADGAPTAEQLRELLPPGSKLGEGWSDPEPTEDRDSGTDSEIEEQCPDATLEGEDDENAVDVTYTNDDGSELRITFDNEVREVSDQEFADYVSALADCSASWDDPENGNHFEVEFDAVPADDLGDLGARGQADFTVTTAEGRTVEFSGYVIAAKRGPVGMTIEGFDGIANDGSVTTFDTELLNPLGSTLDEALDDLVG